MIPHVGVLLEALEGLAPQALAEKWDNVGLLVGSRENTASSILIGLDPTTTLVEEAIALAADTIITHHPVIFKPLSAINTDDPAGRLLQKALSHNITIIGCHTNFDSASGGVNDVLAEGLGLGDLAPLLPAGEVDQDSSGLGRIGRYATPVSREEFLRRLFRLLNLDSFNVAGEIPDTISSVALCGGSGSDLAQTAYTLGADVYLSAEIKHATALWAREAGFAIIDGTHYATEKPATIHLADRLRAIAAENDWQMTIQLTETEEHPFVSHHINMLNEQP